MRDILKSKALLSAVVAYAAAITASNLIPLQVAAFTTRQHLNDEEVGTVALCETLMLAMTTIIASSLPARLGRIAGVAGPVLVIGGQLLSLQAPGLVSLCAVRAMVGAGCGFAGAVVARSLSASGSAASAFGLANGLSAVLIGLLFLGIPWYPSSDPGVRVFIPLAALASALALTTYLATGFGSSTARDGTLPGSFQSDDSNGRSLPSLALVLATLLIYIPLGGIWTFSVQLGVSLGMSERLVGTSLIFAVFGGFLGGALVPLIQPRTGNLIALLMGSILAVTACAAVGAAHSALTFTVAFGLYSAAYQYVISVLQGVGSLLDRRGRLPGILLGMTLVGYAIGSYAVGYLLNSGHPALVFNLGGWACALAAIPCVWVDWWLRKCAVPVQSPTEGGRLA